MRFSRVLIATVAVFAGVASMALAQKMPPERTAETLYESCSSNDQTTLMRCKAYLAGIADSMDFFAAYQSANGSALKKVKLTLKPFAICHSEPWRAAYLRQDYLDWAAAHPERMQSDQYIAAMDALHDALPCK
jgi:hypothetical protein